MSLRSFHIFFVVTALSLLGFLAYWSGDRIAHGQDGVSHAMLACACLGLAAGVPYLAWFVRKSIAR